MKEGRPLTVRFTPEEEKRVRIFAIEKDIGVSAAIRALVSRGLSSQEATVSVEQTTASSPTVRRRVLSRGVLP